MNKTATVSVSRWVIDKKTGKVRRWPITAFPRQFLKRGESSAFPGTKNSWCTTRETVRVSSTPAVHRGHRLSSCHRTPHGGFCLDSELSPCLCAETIYAGEDCAQPGDRARPCSCCGRGTGRHIAHLNRNSMNDSHEIPQSSTWLSFAGGARASQDTGRGNLRATRS
jgi:hypothetical protein